MSTHKDSNEYPHAFMDRQGDFNEYPQHTYVFMEK